MDAQQLHDLIIKPTLEYMGGNYYSKDAAFLLLCTAAIESNCGHYIKQVNGPALGVWQMEPATHKDIYINCDALKTVGVDCSVAYLLLQQLKVPAHITGHSNMIDSPMYACAMARLKYSMDSEALPDHTDIGAVYDYYKRIYNTHLGASTLVKFVAALSDNKIERVKL